ALEMNHVVQRETGRVHGEETVERLHRAVADPVERGVKAKRFSRLLNCVVQGYVVFVPYGPVADGGDHESDDTRRVPEVFYDPQTLLWIAERQIEHRLDLGIAGEDALTHPTRVGPGEAGLDLGHRMQAEIEHRGRKD